MEVRAEGRGVGNEGLRALVVALAETTSLLKTPRESALERNCVSYSAAPPPSTEMTSRYDASLTRKKQSNTSRLNLRHRRVLHVIATTHIATMTHPGYHQ